MTIKPDSELDSLQAHLAEWTDQVRAACETLNGRNIVARIWERDHTVWKPGPQEISNRLGWLYCPENMQKHITEIDRFVEEIKAAGYTRVILLGMGGSSLAPEVFRSVLGLKDGFPDLAIMDSTDPGAVLACDKQHDFETTLFIVATKSGGTVETLSLFKYFYNRLRSEGDEQQAGQHFIAITDPGSSLERMAGELLFRKTFLNDPDIGGRYSALSFFGLVPAALIGVDLDQFLAKARQMMDTSQISNCTPEAGNTPALLGAIMGSLALAGRDKLTLISSAQLSPLGAWIEQLVAESTGKEGRGILPVTTEPLAGPSVYGPDRLFVSLALTEADEHQIGLDRLIEAGFPVVRLVLPDIMHLGAEMYRWEIATAVASHLLNVNPFDQPNVEAAKVLARTMVKEYQQTGSLPKLSPSFIENDIAVITSQKAGTISDVMSDMLDITTGTGSVGRPYLAIQAFINPTPATDKLLTVMSEVLRNRFKLATTFGYGPRFLHSTGQLHKGDAGFGLFIQITAEMPEDAGIPDGPGQSESSISFAVLKDTQSLGDRQALLDNKRTVLRFELTADIERDLNYIISAIK